MIDEFPKETMESAATLHNDKDFIRIKEWLRVLEMQIAVKGMKAKDPEMVKEYQGAYKLTVELGNEFRKARDNVDRAKKKKLNR